MDHSITKEKARLGDIRHIARLLPAVELISMLVVEVVAVGTLEPTSAVEDVVSDNELEQHIKSKDTGAKLVTEAAAEVGVRITDHHLVGGVRVVRRGAGVSIVAVTVVHI